MGIDYTCMRPRRWCVGRMTTTATHYYYPPPLLLLVRHARTRTHIRTEGKGTKERRRGKEAETCEWCERANGRSVCGCPKRAHSRRNRSIVLYYSTEYTRCYTLYAIRTLLLHSCHTYTTYFPFPFLYLICIYTRTHIHTDFLQHIS
jgi:hypothetical protein